MKKHITVVIVHWNTPLTLEKQLSNCINDQNDLQIIVVDNASKSSISWIKEKFPFIILIENKINYGFGSACNRGALEGKGEWLLFLNPDVEINSARIRQLIYNAEKNKYDAISPSTHKKEYNKPIPSVLSLLAEFTPLGKLLPLRLFTLKTLTGGCLLIKRSVFFSLGGFDERFFLWFEDSDLSFRLVKNKYKMGRIQSSILHKGGESFKSLDDQYKRDIFFHSMNIYAKKHFNFLGRCMVWLIKKKYSSRKILPIIGDHTSITIPNMKALLLSHFFSYNIHGLGEIDELIIVSSAIDNKNVWKWRKAYPTVRFIPIETNRGFASTVNIGLSVSTGSWIGTINDDVVLQENCISICLLYKNNTAGSLNPIIYKKNNTIESAGIIILKKGKAVPCTSLPRQTTSFTTDVSNGAAVIYQKSALNEVGLFDERFGSYLEDIDLSLRLKRKGYTNRVATQSSIIHYGQSTSKHSLGRKKRFYDARNWIYVIIKNWSMYDLIRYSPDILLERLKNLWGIAQ